MLYRSVDLASAFAHLEGVTEFTVLRVFSPGAGPPPVGLKMINLADYAADHCRKWKLPLLTVVRAEELAGRTLVCVRRIRVIWLALMLEEHWSVTGGDPFGNLLLGEDLLGGEGDANDDAAEKPEDCSQDVRLRAVLQREFCKEIRATLRAWDALLEVVPKDDPPGQLLMDWALSRDIFDALAALAFQVEGEMNGSEEPSLSEKLEISRLMAQFPKPDEPPADWEKEVIADFAGSQCVASPRELSVPMLAALLAKLKLFEKMIKRGFCWRRGKWEDDEYCEQRKAIRELEAMGGIFFEAAPFRETGKIAGVIVLPDYKPASLLAQWLDDAPRLFRRSVQVRRKTIKQKHGYVMFNVNRCASEDD